MDQHNQQATHGRISRARYLPPLSLSPILRRRISFLDQNQQNFGDEAALSATKTKKMNSKTTCDPHRRRNGVCNMLMPAEYFAVLPHLELLNVRYQFGLDRDSLVCFPDDA